MSAKTVLGSSAAPAGDAITDELIKSWSAFTSDELRAARDYIIDTVGQSETADVWRNLIAAFAHTSIDIEKCIAFLLKWAQHKLRMDKWKEDGKKGKFEDVSVAREAVVAKMEKHARWAVAYTASRGGNLTQKKFGKMSPEGQEMISELLAFGWLPFTAAADLASHRMNLARAATVWPMLMSDLMEKAPVPRVEGAFAAEEPKQAFMWSGAAALISPNPSEHKELKRAYAMYMLCVAQLVSSKTEDNFSTPETSYLAYRKIIKYAHIQSTKSHVIKTPAYESWVKARSPQDQKVAQLTEEWVKKTNYDSAWYSKALEDLGIAW